MFQAISLLFFLIAFVACSDSGSSHSSEPTSDNEIEGFVLLKSGSVTIGSNDKSFKVYERPAMSVLLDYDFYMGIHEVTCGEYAEIANKAKLKTFGKCENDSLPITDITYYDAVLFANAQSKQKKYDTAYTYSKAIYTNDGHCTNLEGFAFHADVKAFRLPTEAEWIYAATRVWNVKKSWNSGNSEYKLHSVCTAGSDSAGFCDMAGNAMEWVNDWMGTFHDTTVTNYIGAPDGGDMGEKVVKGGCYTSSETELNPYSRGDVYTVTSSTRAEYVGFRLAFGSIPNALWMGDDGISQTSIVTSLAGNETVKGITGSYNAKLAFRNDVSGNIAIIDYLNGASSVKEITKNIDAYHPEISPDGKWIAYCTSFEGVSGKSTVYVQSLEEKAPTPIKLDAEKAVVPRWRVLETGDTVIVFVTDAGNNKEESAFRVASTWQVAFAGGKFGIPQKLFDGAYHGGISEDNSLAITGARLLRARVDGRDTVWYNGEQACNASLAMDRSKRTAFLDFSGQTGKDFVGSNYSTHQRILIADSTGTLEQSILAPSGYTFDHAEWTTDNTKTNIVATLTNMNGAHTKIVLVNPLDSSVTELAEGEELWHPNLWVKKKTVKRSSSSTAISSSSTATNSSSVEISSSGTTSSSSEVLTSSSSESVIGSSSEIEFSSSSETIIPLEPELELDPDSAGIYYNSTGNYIAARWRYKMELLWQYKDSANVVILGSSRPLLGINPFEFKEPFYAVNLANTENTNYGSKYIFHNYVIPHFSKLKYIIISTDLDRWYHDDDYNFFYESYKNFPGYIYDANHNFWVGENTENLYNITYESIGNASEGTILRQTRGYRTKASGNWEQNNPPLKIDSLWFSSNSSVYYKNFNLLIDIIDEAASLNITVVGVEFPESPGYRNTGSYGIYGLKRSQMPDLLQEIKDISKTHPNFVFFDENKMGNHDYTDNMATDADHLATLGAEQLTKRLDSLLRTLDIDLAP